jgi:small-conductance mechanosensitive channel
MNFEIQNALGGKVIASRSDLTRLRNAMTLLPNVKFEILPPPASPPPVAEKDEDDDDIMHDPDIQEMVENGEHTCHMFDAHCQACEDDEEDDDEDDITLADLKEQLEDNMTLAEIQQQLDKVEAAKKRLETIRLKKEKKEEEEEEVREWVDEATFAARSRDNMPNF